MSANPVVPIAALMLAALVIVAASGGGYFPGDWYPAALYALVLVAMALLWVPAGRAPARAVLVACWALAGYAAWSYLSILWADQKGDAWDGANRTALYALVFAAFALWPLRGRVAAVLVGGFALAIGAMAVYELVRIAFAAHPTAFFVDGRLATPIAYPSGNAALWSTAFWPCVVFGSRRELGPELRGIFVGAAVVLGSMALMGQSRGWLFALPVVAVVFLAIAPGRVRTPLTLLVVLAGVGVTIPAVLDVYDKRGERLAAALDGASNWILGAAVAAGALAVGIALVDRRRRFTRLQGRRAGAAMMVAAAVALVVGAGVYVGARGSPFTDVAHAWSQFKTKGNPKGGHSRLDRLGSNRYDFWRVSLDQFAGAPIAGIGADNFRAAYLRAAHSVEQPRYPHSLPLRALAQTGLVGAALLAVAIGAAIAAACRAVRGRSGLAAAAAAAGLAGFVYWIVHGAVDWFWEMPALGWTAFALAGIAAGLQPRTGSVARRPLARGAPAVAAVAAGTILVGASFGAPALAERLVNRATAVYPRDPARAFDELDSAAALNPLSPRPKLMAARVALALHRPGIAAHYFRGALARQPDEAYAELEYGAVLFDSGDRAHGLRTLERAVALQPRLRVPREALARARAGRRVDVDRINAELLREGKALVR